MKTKAVPRRRSIKVAPRSSHGDGLIVKLIRIGNSRGIRLPKAVIEQAGLTDEVDITVRKGSIVLQSRRRRRRRRPREGWAESIKAAVEKHGHDVDEEFLALPNDFSEEEWTWPQNASTSTSSRSTRRPARK
jgi:antitoxin MazE